MKKPRKQLRMRAIRTTLPRIDFKNNFNDWRCLVMIVLGFSYRFISDETGLTTAQIWYRGFLVGIRVGNYRDGAAFGATTLDEMLEKAERYVRKHLR
jgi:hypothetical protein